VLSLSIIDFALVAGTMISAFAVFCCGKHDYEKNIVAFFYNLLAGILQSATIFLLVGWIWSIRWGILFVQLSGMVLSKEKERVRLLFLWRARVITRAVMRRRRRRRKNQIGDGNRSSRFHDGSFFLQDYACMKNSKATTPLFQNSERNAH
jgi:hypothetical protein